VTGSSPTGVPFGALALSGCVHRVTTAVAASHGVALSYRGLTRRTYRRYWFWRILFSLTRRMALEVFRAAAAAASLDGGISLSWTLAPLQSVAGKAAPLPSERSHSLGVSSPTAFLDSGNRFDRVYHIRPFRLQGFSPS